MVLSMIEIRHTGFADSIDTYERELEIAIAAVLLMKLIS
jgi:hypothetical protein